MRSLSSQNFRWAFDDGDVLIAFTSSRFEDHQNELSKHFKCPLNAFRTLMTRNLPHLAMKVGSNIESVPYVPLKITEDMADWSVDIFEKYLNLHQNKFIPLRCIYSPCYNPNPEAHRTNDRLHRIFKLCFQNGIQIDATPVEILLWNCQVGDRDYFVKFALSLPSCTHKESPVRKMAIAWNRTDILEIMDSIMSSKGFISPIFMKSNMDLCDFQHLLDSLDDLGKTVL